MRPAADVTVANAEEERLRQFDLREIDSPDQRDHFALKYMARVEAVVDAIRAHVAPPGWVLEVGCAQGNTSLLLAEAGYRALPLDLMPDALRYARRKWQRGDFHPLCASAVALPLREGSVDAVVAGELLEHCARPVEVLRGLAECLRPGGIMVVTTPNGARWGRELCTFRQVKAEEVEGCQFGPGGEDHLFEFTLEELVQAVSEAGLEPISATTHASLLHTNRFDPLKRLFRPQTLRRLSNLANRLPFLGPRTALTLLVVAQKARTGAPDGSGETAPPNTPMTTLVFADEHSATEARDLVEGKTGACSIPMVVRESDLRVLEYPGLGIGDATFVAEESDHLAGQLQRLLPRLFRAPRSGGVSVWDCYAESFRSWAVAPLLSNARIVGLAARQHEDFQACVVENPRKGTWWAFRHQVHEAVRAGLLGTGVEPMVTPAEPLRTLRTLSIGLAPVRGMTQAIGGAQLRKRLSWMRSLPKPQQADVLFLAIGSTSAPIIDRLAPRLQEGKVLSCAGLTFFTEDMGITADGRGAVPYQYVDNFHASSALGHGSWTPPLQMLTAWPGWLLGLALSGGDKQFGRLWPAIRNRLVSSLGRDAQQILADLDAADRVLDAYRPRCIVAFHLYWHRMAPLVLQARAKGVPVVYLQHGIYLAKDQCTTPLPFDEYLVFGQAAAETLAGRTHGLPVRQVGHCLYDELIAGSAGRSHESAAEQRTVLIATQPHQEELAAMRTEGWWVRGVALACRELGVKAVIKLHPRDVATEGHYELQRQMPETVEVVAHGTRSLPEMIAEADCLLTVDSTVVLEANLLGTPVIVVNLTGNRDRFPFVADGGAVGAYRYEDILPALRGVLESAGADLSGTRGGFLQRHLGFTDGQSTERVVESIARYARARE